MPGRSHSAARSLGTSPAVTCGWSQRWLAAATLFLFLPQLTSSDAPAQSTGVTAFFGPPRKPQWELLFTKYLSEEVGAKLNPPRNFTGVAAQYPGEPRLEEVIQNRADYVLSPLTATACFVAKYNALPLVTPIVAGQTWIGGVIFVRKDDNRIQTLKHLRGKNIAAVYLWAIEGWALQAERAMAEEGLHVLSAANKIMMSSTAKQIAGLVRDGSADVGFLGTPGYRAATTEGEFRVVLEMQIPGFEGLVSSTDIVPGWAMSALPHVPRQERELVRSAMINLQPESPTAQALGISGFDVAESYASVVATMQRQGIVQLSETGPGVQCFNEMPTLYDNIHCPPGSFKRAKDQALAGCEERNESCYGTVCLCQPCLESPAEVFIQPLTSIGDERSERCTRSAVCGETYTGRDLEFRVQDFLLREGVTVEAHLLYIDHDDLLTPQQLLASPESTNAFAYRFALTIENPGLFVLQIAINGSQVSDSPFYVKVSYPPCQTGRTRVGADCRCEEGEMQFSGKCMAVAAVLVSVAVPALLVLGLVAAFFLRARLRAADALWHVDSEELVYDDPPKTLGFGTHGEVLHAVYRETEVAVKRWWPSAAHAATERNTRGSQGGTIASDVPTPTSAGEGFSEPGGEWTSAGPRSFEMIRSASAFSSESNARQSSLPELSSPSATGVTREGSSIPRARDQQVYRRLSLLSQLQVEATAAQGHCDTASLHRNQPMTAPRTSVPRIQSLRDSARTTPFPASPTHSNIARNPSLSEASNHSFTRTTLLRRSVAPPVFSSSASTGEAGSRGQWLSWCFCQSPAAWRKKAFIAEMRLLARLRHPRITTVMGAVTKGRDVMLVMELMDYGSLHDLYMNEMVDFDDGMAHTILLDVCAGMHFLHTNSPPICHGDLKGGNILIDSQFRAKVSDFGIFTFGKLHVGTPYWTAPEVLRGGKVSVAADVYAFSITMQELFIRGSPYPQDDVMSVLLGVTDPELNLRPEIPTGCGLALAALMRRCWVADPTERPSFQQVREALTAIDVREYRNLFKTKHQPTQPDAADTHALLYSLFPQHVAEAMMRGQKPEEDRRECATIFFSDIVGFTNLSSAMESHDVSAMLERLFSRFDELAAMHGVYKLETIGDCFIAATNLVQAQAEDHVARIARFSLAVIQAAEETLVDLSDPSKGHVTIRVGFDAGPVVGNVVGSKNKKYTVFGNTVNTASRMESTGIPGQIQCTLRAAALLYQQEPACIMKAREGVQVKGRGTMTTYILKGLAPEGEIAPAPVLPPPQIAPDVGGKKRPGPVSGLLSRSRDAVRRESSREEYERRTSVNTNSQPGSPVPAVMRRSTSGVAISIAPDRELFSRSSSSPRPSAS